MATTNFEKSLQRRLAQSAITNSALRNQGEKGLLEACRDYCEHIQLDRFFAALQQPETVASYLDICTEELRKKLAEQFKNGISDTAYLGWGTTRKALNLFFAAVVSNHYMAQRYGLPADFDLYCAAVNPLEVALDSHVAKGLKEDGMAEGLTWLGVKHLTPDMSRQYQQRVRQRAKALHLAPIHLDVLYWRKDRDTANSLV